MEALDRVRRRLALLYLHINPARETLPSACLSTLSCASTDAIRETQVKKQDDCVFCRIICGEAPALKVVADMCSKVPLIGNAVMKATGCDSFNLLVNNGVAAGQVIFHTHIHIIPRKAHDCLWASESLRRLSLELDQEASQLAKCIRDNLSVTTDWDDHNRRPSTHIRNQKEG